MRYVPNLIPESSKVLPDYFKGSIYNSKSKNPIIDTLFWCFGVLSFFGAIVWLIHPLLSLIFVLLGFILMPPGQRVIEKKLRFKMTLKIKAITGLILFIGAIILSSYYSGIDIQYADQQKILNEKNAKEKIVANQKEQQRKDSLAFYIKQSEQLVINHKIQLASKQLEYALAFASTPSDKKQIEQVKANIASVRVLYQIKEGKYRVALNKINELLQADPNNSDLLYNRAVCYSKMGENKKAVTDLKRLIKSGNKNAKKLHNKINPIKKRIAYYVTRCCDGTISYSTGRGTCSHHGGVCDWNEPIYEEYRKY